MYLKIVICSFLLVIIPHILRVVYILGYHVVVFNHAPGPCHLIPGVEYGSEDMETLPNGLTFITSGMKWSLSPPTHKEFYKRNNIKGKVFLFDFNSPDKGVIELGFSEDFDRSTFAPHGMSVLQDEETGRVVLFVVNHLPGFDSIEKFVYVPEKQLLDHLASYTGPEVHLVNDIAATSENSFYFTNYADGRGLLQFTMELLLLLPWGNIMYFDGTSYRLAQDGLVIPNGILLSKDKRAVYSANGAFNSINIYRRNKDDSLTLTQEFPIYSGPDNILLEPGTGNLVTGTHPSIAQVVKHFEDHSVSAPSKVLLIHMKNDTYAERTTELYSEDGHTLYGSSVASIYNGSMLIGSVIHKLLFCELKAFT